MCDVMTAYFGKISEENIKNNFVLIYELLDGKGSLFFCHSFRLSLSFFPLALFPLERVVLKE